MNRLRYFAVCSLLMALIVSQFGCTKDIGALPPQPKLLCDTITYTKHIEPIIRTKCYSCHGDISPSGGFPLTSYTALRSKAEAGKIEARVILGQPSFMPAGSGPLPQDQLDLISCWLKNGYKE